MGARAMIGAVSVLWVALAGSGSMKAQEPEATGAPRAIVSKSATMKTGPSKGTPAEAVARLVEQLERHPVQPRPVPGRVAIYMMDLVDGKVTLIADQPAPGLTYCGSPAWSHDGRRILFDASPGPQFSLTRLQSIEPGPGRPTVTDLGAGNCPTLSSAGDRIAFLSNVVGAQSGIWLMNADGSGRRALGEYGIPKWSPDGGQMMIVTFGDDREVTIMDTDPQKSGVLSIPNARIHSVPSWAGRGLIVAVIGDIAGDRVALIDVSVPAQASVKEVLWRRADGPDIKPGYPVYSSASRRCVFVGGRADGMSLYSVQAGKGAPAKRLGKEGALKMIVNLDFSPDGRYVLYAVHGPG